MRKHRIEIRSLCVLQKVNLRDFGSDDEVKARKAGWETVERRETMVVFEIVEGECEGKICANILC